MAKAGSDSITDADWISLGEALAPVADFYGERSFAERVLFESLATGKVGWRYRSCINADGEIQLFDKPAVGDPSFWSWNDVIAMNWDESWVKRVGQVVGEMPRAVIKIEVSQHDLTALLPAIFESASHPDGLEISQAQREITTKVWIIDEARRMKTAGEISANIIKTDFAKLLARRLKEGLAFITDQQSVRQVRWRYIMNQLSGWDLWPIEKIK